MGPRLRELGLIFVGIDVIGGLWLTEINVTSPTGPDKSIAESLKTDAPMVVELRLGIALSLIGAPFFGWLLLRMRKGRL